MNFRKCILPAAFFVGASAAQAEENDRGFYLFGSAGKGVAKLEHSDLGVRRDASRVYVPASSDSATTWELGGGYRFNRFLGVEVSYADLGRAKTSLAGATTSGDGAARGAWTGQRLAVVGTLPVNDRFDVYGKLSLNNVRGDYALTMRDGASVSLSETEIRGGIGLGGSLALNRNWRLRGEYEYIAKGNQDVTHSTMNAPEIRLFKAGLVFQF